MKTSNVSVQPCIPPLAKTVGSKVVLLVWIIAPLCCSKYVGHGAQIATIIVAIVIAFIAFV